MRGTGQSPIPQHRLWPVMFCLALAAGQAWADGLPGEFMLTSRWRTLNAAYSPLPNPAFLTEVNYLSARCAFARTLQEFNKLELGASIPMGLYQAAGFTWFSLGTASYQAVSDFQSLGNEVNANDNYFVFSYAINPWRRLSVGLNVSVAYQNLFDEANRVGVGVDAGLSWRLLRHPLLGDHLVGVSMVNLKPPNLPTTAPESLDMSSELQAASLHLTLNSTYWEKRIESAFDLSLKDVYEGAEEWDLNARLGTWVLRLFNVYGLVGWANTGYRYAGFALGFNLPSVNNGRDLAFEYQMLSVAEGDAFTHSLYLRGEFGKHREEVYARRMARLLNIEPNDLYNRALMLYSNRQFWDAYFVFGRIVSEYPDFFKRDWVAYYMASCMENLDMREAAHSEYARAKSDFPRSAMIPNADLGQMRIYYRQDDHSSVAMQLNRLTTPEVRDSLKYHAYYLMGETHLKLGEYRKARQVFEMIPPSHPEFVFAQHSLAVSNAISGQDEDAIANLHAVINSVPHGRTQEEAVNRSLLFLGYLFYELSTQMEGSLSQSITALRTVAKDSYYYEDALLGMGWVAVKARQWEDCIDAGNKLMTTSRRVPLRAEGALLQAYGRIMRKDYIPAVALLTEARSQLTSYKPVDADSVAFLDRRYESTRTDYGEVAAKAQTLAAARQSEHVMAIVDSLGGQQRQVKRSIDDHLRFLDENRRNTFFGRSVPQVSEDVEYALAVAQKLAGVRAAAQDSKDAMEKQRLIDEQIRKLKAEMQKLEQDNAPKEQPQQEQQ